MMLKKLQKLLLQNSLLIILLLIGVTSWSLPMVKSGLVYDYGMGFWGANGHDGVWHIALSKSLLRGTLEMPTFAGLRLQNYHIGFDSLLALANLLTRIPIHNLYFQIFPPIISVLVGILAYIFVLTWRGSKKGALWSVFFVYFGGSWGWLITLLRDGKMSGESMFWSQQAVSTLINPPFALSLVGLLVGFIFLLKYLDNKQNKYAFGIVIIFGVLIQIKAYAGALGLGALWVTGVYRFLKHKQFDLLSFTLIASIVSLLLFIPLNSGAQGLIVWQPFWFLENMMLLSDRVGWQRYGEAMVNYKNGGNLVKFIPSYAIAFLLFYMGNMGTRLFKEFYVYKKIKTRKISEIEISIAAIILAGILIPTFFIQRGTPWNTIQFSYYTLFFSSIIAGVAVSEVAKSRVISIAIILLTIPTSIITLKNDYLPNRPPAKISKGELEALEFLSNEPEGVVLTYPYDELKAKEAEKNPPRPLALYVSTAYVSAFSNKLVYLEDEINLDITNYEWRERKENLVEFYASLNHEFAQGFLMENNISYIYWLKGQRARLGESQLGIIRIFENSEVDIYRVEASTFAREIQ